MKAHLILNPLEKKNFSNNLQKSFSCFDKNKKIESFNFSWPKPKLKKTLGINALATYKACRASKTIKAPWLKKNNIKVNCFLKINSSLHDKSCFIASIHSGILWPSKHSLLHAPYRTSFLTNPVALHTKYKQQFFVLQSKATDSSISYPTKNLHQNIDNNNKNPIVIDQKSNITNKTTANSDTSAKRLAFPFTAIIGQEEMKLALILNVIDPLIGGVMIMGDRGTGKSTTVRALVDLLPEIQVVANDAFNSDPSDPELMGPEVREKLRQLEELGRPSSIKDELQIKTQKITMVDLPLGATEDRVCGTIDIEKALTEGIKAFEPGLLAKANRGILYVDEVNLLDDHLVDVLLDSAASGWNTVEREGISISHPARFILVGSGNPEEGELRPQLLDRFGMHAQIKTVKDPMQRVQIVEQRAAFDIDPETFKECYIQSQNNLSQQIVNARNLLTKVKIDKLYRVQISQVCSALDVDGLRGDIVTNRASIALAAFEGRENVTPYDISRIISLCLRHRLRKDPLQTIDSGDLVTKAFIETFGENLC